MGVPGQRSGDAERPDADDRHGEREDGRLLRAAGDEVARERHETDPGEDGDRTQRHGEGEPAQRGAGQPEQGGDSAHRATTAASGTAATMSSEPSSSVTVRWGSVSGRASCSITRTVRPGATLAIARATTCVDVG